MAAGSNTKQIEVNGINFNIVDEGEGQPVLLLHGFPDSSLLWRNQLPALTKAGFRIIAPDQRGFGESEKPQDVQSYSFDKLLSDVTGILDACDVQKVHVIGHDWGAFVAWALASFVPDRVDRLVVLSVAHPQAFASAGIEQYEKSWYMQFFQNPFAEEVLKRDDWQLMRAWLRDTTDTERYLDDLVRPGALTGGLNWYRANATPEAIFGVSPAIPWQPVKADTLGVWSDGDAYLVEKSFHDTPQFVAGRWRYERIEGCDHWIPLGAADRLNSLLLDFLG
jgi:pimeloyl-ACP methyl ester carboxylesterase